MDLVISHGDFQRLSTATQQELLSVLTGVAHGVSNADGDEGVDVGSFAEIPIPAYGGHSESSVDLAKRVIGISAEQASELLANLAAKSQQVLRLFAVAERIGIDELVGEECPYRDMNDLKRSFVGAVNRRLRTVVGNRAVVLFSSDRDRRRIRILPLTAAALRQAMGIPDPDIGEVFEEIEPGSDEPAELVCADEHSV
jgi:hypothetical protein